MPHDHSGTVPLWCPGCLTTVDDARTCPNCGMRQDGPDAARSREVVARIHVVAGERMELQRELDDLVDERQRLFSVLRPPRGDPTPVGPVPRGEWRPERVRDVLLWVGALLLVIAAITFAAVAWTRLGPAGRAGILLVVTVASAVLTAFVRRRLRPTAEALAAITIGLGLVDWGVASRTGLRGDLSDAAWWAIGLLVVAACAGATADRVDLTAPRVAAVTLPPVAAVFGLATLHPTWNTAVVAIAVLTAAVVAGRGAVRGRWSAVRPWLTTLAVAGEGAVVLGGVVAGFDGWADTGRVGAAAAVLSMALPPLVAGRIAVPGHRPDPAPAAGIATIALLGSGMVLASGTIPDHWLLAMLAIGAVVAAIGGRLLPDRARIGVTTAAVVAVIAPAVATVPNVTAAWLRPIEWLQQPWTLSLGTSVVGHLGRAPSAAVHDVGPTFVVLTCLALLAGVVLIGRRATERATVAAALASVGVAIGVAALGPTIGVALLVQLFVATGVVVVAVLADRRAPASPAVNDALVVAAIAVFPAVGWAAVSPAASLVGLGAVIGLGAFATVALRSPAYQAGSAAAAGSAFLGGAAVVLAERGIEPTAGGTAITALAVAVLVVTRLVRRRGTRAATRIALEAVGCTGAVIGVAAAGTAPTARVVAYALVTVGFLTAACRDDERASAYATAALVAGAIAGIAGLAPARLAGAWITLPAAALATAIALLPGFAVRDSWRRFGPGLVMAAVTGVAAAVDHGGWRVVVVVAVASVVVAIGARTRLGAPILVGAASLLVLAVDGAAPYAAALPRWLVIGTAGAVALWAGATADRRLAQLRHWRDAIDRLS